MPVLSNSGFKGLPRGDVAAAVRSASAACNERGVQLTPIREAVLSLLWQSDQPMSAYDLIRALEPAIDKKLSPPTIYRVLTFLIEHGFISRIECRNAFIACAQPHHEHTCVFFICDECGRSTEIENEKADLLFDKDAAALGFQIQRRVIEMQGTCADCRSAGNDAR